MEIAHLNCVVFRANVSLRIKIQHCLVYLVSYFIRNHPLF